MVLFIVFFILYYIIKNRDYIELEALVRRSHEALPAIYSSFMMEDYCYADIGLNALHDVILMETHRRFFLSTGLNSLIRLIRRLAAGKIVTNIF